MAVPVIFRTILISNFARVLTTNTALIRYQSQNILNSKMDWQSAKAKIASMPIEEKRKLYSGGDFITLDEIETWSQYHAKYNLNAKKASADDLKEFEKIKIDSSLNKILADKVSIFKGDITKLEIDAIVNAANSELRGGGGVDGAIHRAAGKLLLEECRTLGGCPTGDAKVTGGYNLPAKYVIHTVGPQDGSASQLRSCYNVCFKYQVDMELKTIAFPCISTGVYGFPNREAGHIALSTARQFLEKSIKENTPVDRIIFCTFMPIDVDIYETLLKVYFPTN